MDTLLQSANIAIRERCPLDSDEDVIVVFRRGTFLQLTFQTTGCKFNARGSCSMCNYGHGKAPETDILLEKLYRILDEAEKMPTESILLGASGSFLDTNEIPEILQDLILAAVLHSRIPNVIIETHYRSINKAALERMARRLPNRKVELEIGLESANSWLRTHILNKDIDSDAFENIIASAHRFGITITINLLLGIPFLSESAQLADTRSSIQWVLSKGADYIVVFPVNIHPYTLFEWLYEKKKVRSTSLWLLFYLLAELDEHELEHISVSWYGNRTIRYADRSSIPLHACDSCRNALVNFFDDFSQNKDTLHRQTAIAKMKKAHFFCTCRESVKSAISSEPIFHEVEYYAARHEMEELIGRNGN